MSCTFDKEKLTAYFDNELDALGRGEVERHISTCSECLRELGEVKSAADAIRSLPRLRVPASVGTAVARELQAPAVIPFPRRRNVLQWAVAAAAAVLVGLSAVYFATLEKRPERETAKTSTEIANAPTPRDQAPKKPETDSLRRMDKALPKEEEAKANLKQQEKVQKNDEKDLELQDGKDKQRGLQHNEEERKANDGYDSGRKGGDKGGENKEGKAETPKTDDTTKREELAKEKEKDFRGRATGGKSLLLYQLAAADMAKARGRLEDELAKMKIRVEVGAGEADQSQLAKDTCIVVELTDAELAALQKRLAGEKVLTFGKSEQSLEDCLGGRRKLAPREDSEEGGQADRLKDADKKTDAKKAMEPGKKDSSDDRGAGTGGGGGTGADKKAPTKEADPAQSGGAQKPKADEPSAEKKKSGDMKPSGKESEGPETKSFGATNRPEKRRVVIYFKELTPPAEKKKE
jgi:hypothetical protein